LKHLSSSVLRILGKKPLLWLCISAGAGIGLSVVEVQLSVFIQLFLQSLGMPMQVDTGAFGLLPTSTSLGGLMVILAVIGISRSMCQLVVMQASSIAQESCSARLRRIALRDLLYSPHHRYVSAADTHTRLGEIFPKTSQFFFHLAQGIPLLVMAGILTLILFTLSVPSALISLGGLGIIGGLLIPLNRAVGHSARKIPHEQAHLLRGVERVTRNWLLVRVFRTHTKEFRILSGNIAQYASHAIRAQFLGATGMAIPQILGIFLLIGLLLLHITVLHTSASQVVAFLYLFLRLVQTLAQAMAYLGAAAVFFPNVRWTHTYLAEFSSAQVEAATTMMLDNKGEEIPRSSNHPVAPNVEITDLSFRHASQPNYLFNRFQLSVQAGQQMGIVGASGSGKSTLLALILGVLQGESGSVHVGGIPADAYLKQYTDWIGFVGAEPFLLAGTLAENLSYGASHVYTEKEYAEALAQASLLSFVEGLPEGLSYRIQENGDGLSAGQKQRLSIARALLRKPVLLVLDEVTANLDAKTEQEIVETVASLKGSCTTLWISHRPEALRCADVVLELA